MLRFSEWRLLRLFHLPTRRSCRVFREYCGVGLLLGLVASSVSAQPAPSAHELSTYESLRHLLYLHPEARVSEAQMREWEQNAAGAMGLPNPSITLGLNNVPVDDPTRFDKFLPTSRSLEIMQSIPNVAGRSAERDTWLARADLAALERLAVLANLEQMLLTALFERRRIAESLAVLDHQLGLVAELEHWLRGEIEGGASVYGRFDEFDVQRSKIDERKRALTGEDERWQAKLRALLEQVPDIEPPVIAPRSWDGEPDSFIAVRLAAQRLAVARAQSREKRADFKPDFALGVAYQQREAGVNFPGDDWFTVKLSVSVPLWAKSNQKPKLAASEEAVLRLAAEKQQRLREARARYDEAAADYQTAGDLLQQLQERARQLEALEAANRRSYESGDTELEAVIRPAIERSELVLEQARQRARQAIAAAQINALIVEIK